MTRLTTFFLEKRRFVSDGDWIRPLHLYAMVMGMYWGLGNYFMADGGLNPGQGGIFMATKPTGTNYKDT